MLNMPAGMRTCARAQHGPGWVASKAGATNRSGRSQRFPGQCPDTPDKRGLVTVRVGWASTARSRSQARATELGARPPEPPCSAWGCVVSLGQGRPGRCPALGFGAHTGPSAAGGAAAGNPAYRIEASQRRLRSGGLAPRPKPQGTGNPIPLSIAKPQAMPKPGQRPARRGRGFPAR